MTNKQTDNKETVCHPVCCLAYREGALDNQDTQDFLEKMRTDTSAQAGQSRSGRYAAL
jgi:hypothetical protein